MSWRALLELPPRARRIPRHVVPPFFQAGTTSACAENTPHLAESTACLRNYLRVRGEYYQEQVMRIGKEELPPRARRIRVLDSDPGTGYGTTSACAENTRVGKSIAGNTRNYLRVRGEYAVCTCEGPSSLELPPRARRIRLRCTPSSHPSGTTSACAENTNGEGDEDKQNGNYLRVRGEYP